MSAQKTAEKAKEALRQGGAKAVDIPKTFAHSNSEQIGDFIRLYRAQISQAVPKHLTAERIIQLATTVIASNPTLKECTPASIIGAVMNASVLGLDITPQFGQCFFIPRNNKKTGQKEANFQMGYKGYIQLIRRSGEVSTVYAYAVRENDLFEYELGLEPKLRHTPARENRGEMIYAYAVIRFKDGGYLFEILNRAEVMRARERSEAKNSEYSPWNTEDEESMWRKTAIRRIQNYAPLSAEFQKAIVSDGATINLDMFDNNTKELDMSKVQPAEFTVEPPEAKPEPKKDGPKPDPAPAAQAAGAQEKLL